MAELEALREILMSPLGGGISCRAQPIIRLHSGRVLGHELLCRGPAGSPLEQPLALFSAAERAGAVVELDEECRRVLLWEAATLADQGLFFVNVHPEAILRSRSLSSVSLERLAELGLTPAQVVLEIAEGYTIGDYCEFSRRLGELREAGFQIAIDDFGAGYAGLNALIRIRPQYLKIDRSIIANLSTDAFSRDLLAKVVELARTTLIQIVAEGIETEEQLDRLLDLGVELGQGYLLGRPSPVADITASRGLPIRLGGRRQSGLRGALAMTPRVGELCDPAATVGHAVSCKEVYGQLERAAGVAGLVVMRQGEPVGLVMRGPLLQRLSGRYGYSLYENRPISVLMDTNPLIASSTAPLLEVSALSMKRSADRLYDLVIVADEGRLHGVVSVQRLMEATTAIQLQRATHLNPLTGLPGNRLIDQELRRLMQGEAPFTLIYADLDNFKGYNDLYGFERGDDMIRMTAELLAGHFSGPGWEDTVVGHVGGDDFAVLTPRQDVAPVCAGLSAAFLQRVRSFFTDEHQELGGFPGVDRSGVNRQFPLTGLTVVPLPVDPANFRTPDQVAALAAHLKRRAKWKRVQGVE